MSLTVNSAGRSSPKSVGPINSLEDAWRALEDQAKIIQSLQEQLDAVIPVPTGGTNGQVLTLVAGVPTWV